LARHRRRDCKRNRFTSFNGHAKLRCCDQRLAGSAAKMFQQRAVMRAAARDHQFIDVEGTKRVGDRSRKSINGSGRKIIRRHLLEVVHDPLCCFIAGSQ
jgi:hypothetical protein